MDREIVGEKGTEICAEIEEGIPGCLVKNFVTNLSLNLVKNSVRMPNLVTNSVTYFVRNVVAHLYLHQI